MGLLEQAKEPVLNEAQRALLEKDYKTALNQATAYANGLFDLARDMGIDTSKLSEAAPEVDVVSKIDAIDPKKGTLKLNELFGKVNELRNTLTAYMPKKKGNEYIANLNGDPRAANLIDTWGPNRSGAMPLLLSGDAVTSRMAELDSLRALQPDLVTGKTPEELDNSDLALRANAEQVADLNQLNLLGFENSIYSGDEKLNDLLHSAGMDSRITAYIDSTRGTTVAVMPTKDGMAYQIIDGVSHNGWRSGDAMYSKEPVKKTLKWLTPAVLKGKASSAEDLRKQVDDMMDEKDGKYLDPKLVTKIAAPTFEVSK